MTTVSGAVPGGATLALLLSLAVAAPVSAEDVRLEAPETIAPGERFEVRWQGPDAPGDFIAVAGPGTAPSGFLDYARTSRGNPATLEAPTAGDYEVRYVSAAALRVLASAPLTVGGAGPSSAATRPAPEVALMALAAVDRGRDFHVAWRGPGAAGDRIAILPAGADAAAALTSRPVGDGSPLGLAAPERPGDYEIVLVAAGGDILARRPLEVR